jgi:hypothetical protein
MKQIGWVRLHRSLLGHPLMRELPASWLRVWLAILLRANYRSATWRDGTSEIEIPSGSLVTSIRKLAQISGSTDRQVRGALRYLGATGALTCLTTSRYSVLSITNWATYQNSDELDDTPDDTGMDQFLGDTPNDTREDTRHDTVMEHSNAHDFPNLHAGGSTEATHSATHGTTRVATTNKEVKNIRSISPSPSPLDSLPVNGQPGGSRPRSKKQIDPEVQTWFENEFWPLYPRHEGKAKAMEAAGAKATTTEKRKFYLTRLKAQLPAYLQRKQESGQRVIPMASTWFNQDRAEDELATAPEPSGKWRGAPQGDDYQEYVPLSASGGQ